MFDKLLDINVFYIKFSEYIKYLSTIQHTIPKTFNHLDKFTLCFQVCKIFLKLSSVKKLLQFHFIQYQTRSFILHVGSDILPREDRFTINFEYKSTNNQKYIFKTHLTSPLTYLSICVRFSNYLIIIYNSIKWSDLLLLILLKMYII